MSETTLSFTAKINGSLVDVTSITLDDQHDDFGVRRLDTLDTVVAAGTTVPRLSLGTYAYTFTDPEPGLTYEYTVKVVYNTVTYYFNRRTSSPDVTNLITIPTTEHYTSQAEVYRLMGEYAVELMTDDYSGDDKGYMWSDFLYDVDETIKMYVMQHYDPATLYTVDWVRRRATILCCNLLSQRGGNAELYHSRTERVYEELNSLRAGHHRIPGATVRHWMGPAWRNYQVQNRFWYHPSRVESSKSNKQQYPNQDNAIEGYMYTFGV